MEQPSPEDEMNEPENRSNEGLSSSDSAAEEPDTPSGEGTDFPESEYAEGGDETLADGEPEEKAPPLPAGLLRNQPFLTFLLPFVVFALVNSLEPENPAHLKPGEKNENWLVLHIEYEDYPKVYTAKIVLTVLAMLYVLPGYRTFPFSVHWEAFAVGAVGAVVWIALCELQLEDKLYSMLGMTELFDLSRRSSFNPLEQMKDTPMLAYGFLAVRLFGLVVVVSIMEEFFLRGMVMRMFVNFDYWEEVPFGKVNDLALIACTVVPIITHPKTELLAVIAWFSAVTWLMMRRKSIWDCIVAHGVTNLLLGIYVIYSGSWWMM